LTFLFPSFFRLFRDFLLSPPPSNVWTMFFFSLPYDFLARTLERFFPFWGSGASLSPPLAYPPFLTESMVWTTSTFLFFSFFLLPIPLLTPSFLVSSDMESQHMDHPFFPSLRICNWGFATASFLADGRLSRPLGCNHAFFPTLTA